MDKCTRTGAKIQEHNKAGGYCTVQMCAQVRELRPNDLGVLGSDVGSARQRCDVPDRLTPLLLAACCRLACTLVFVLGLGCSMYTERVHTVHCITQQGPRMHSKAAGYPMLSSQPQQLAWWRDTKVVVVGSDNRQSHHGLLKWSQRRPQHIAAPTRTRNLAAQGRIVPHANKCFPKRRPRRIARR